MTKDTSIQVNMKRTAGKGRRLPLFCATGLLVLLGVGCGDFFARRPIEAESMEVLRELRQVRESPGLDNRLPELYRQPPSRVEIKDGAKVFYFTRHHPPEHLSVLLKEQLGVASNPNSSTNQIVVYAKDNAQADQVVAYLDMVDVPPVQVNIDCLILERFGDITTDWETSVLIENFLGEKITLGERLGTFLESKSDSTVTIVQNGVIRTLPKSSFPTIQDWDVLPKGSLIDLEPAFPGASLRETERARFGMDFGYWMDQNIPGHQVRAIVDVLVSRGYLKILLNPTLETVNGRQATVAIKDYTPIEKVKTGLGGASDAYNITEYVWVEDTLTVTPTVYSDGSIGLKTSIKIGSRSKPEGVIQRSIITERSINVEENRIKPGESLVIGGMRKSEKRSVVRGIPFFKDLPIIGILFSSKDFEEKGTEIIFILTPSISSGGQDHAEVVRDIRTKFADPEYKFRMSDMLTDPLGSDTYTGMMERQAAQTEIARIQAEAEAEKAQEFLRQQQQQTEKARQDIRQLRRQLHDLESQAQQAAEEVRRAREEAEKVKQDVGATEQQAQEAARKLQEAEKQAQAAQEQVEQTARQTQEAQEKITRLEQQVRQARQEAEAAQRALEEKRRREEEQRRLEEEKRRQEAAKAEAQATEQPDGQQEAKDAPPASEPEAEAAAPVETPAGS